MTPRPLVLTADPDLLEDLLRVAATAGVELQVAADVAAGRRLWSSAAAVVVGADLAVRCARARLPRRSGVVLLGRDLDDPGIWQLGVTLGAEHVVFLPEADRWLAERLADAVEPPRAAGAVLAVVGGCGGAGATSLAVALALTAARTGRRALLVDGDPLGGGIDLAFGQELDGGLRWPDLGTTRGRLPGAALVAALPRMHDLPVLSWDRTSPGALSDEAMDAVLTAARRCSDLVVVDLPRALDDAARVGLELASTALLVVPSQVRAAAAAVRVAAQVGALCADLRVVVRGPFGGRLAPPAVAAALGLPLAGYLASEPRLAAALERGEPPGLRRRGPLSELCEQLLADLPGAATGELAA